MNKLYLIATVFIIISSSCVTRIKVKVDTFNALAFRQSYEYNYFKTADMLEAELSYKANDRYISDVTTLILSTLKKEYGKELTNTDTSRPSMDTATMLAGLNTASNVVNTELTKASAIYNEAYYSRFSTSGRSTQLMIDKLKQGDSIVNLLFDQLKDIVADFETPDLIISELKRKYHEEIAEVTQFGSGITTDVFASFVTKAPNRYWNRYKNSTDLSKESEVTDRSNLSKVKEARINVSKARTFFGNADIAIKMDGPGNFVIKGVRLDADEAIKASFKVLNQGIKYLAYSQGISIPNSANDASADNTMTKIPELMQLDSNKMSLENLQNLNNAATQMFVNDLLAQYQQMTRRNMADSANRANAIKQMEMSFDLYKLQLNK